MDAERIILWIILFCFIYIFSDKAFIFFKNLTALGPILKPYIRYWRYISRIILPIIHSLEAIFSFSCKSKIKNKVDLNEKRIYLTIYSSLFFQIPLALLINQSWLYYSVILTVNIIFVLTRVEQYPYHHTKLEPLYSKSLKILKSDSDDSEIEYEHRLESGHDVEFLGAQVSHFHKCSSSSLSHSLLPGVKSI